MPVNRRLVAVVVADVVGYSRLMERDEAGTHGRLRKLREELIDPKIAEHGGRTVKTSGDGMLVEFPSATSALRCAVEVQRELGARNLYVAADDKIELRIGINLGDIIVEGDDIIGDGVNVAARLETLAEPGGICVASAIWEQVHEDLGIDFVDAGEQHVKNISKPIRMFRVALGKGARAEGGGRESGIGIVVQQSSAAGARRSPPARVVLLAVIVVGVWQLSQRTVPPAATSAAGPPPRSIMMSAVQCSRRRRGARQRCRLAGRRRVARAGQQHPRCPCRRAEARPPFRQGKPIDERAVGRDANVRYLVAGDVRSAGDEIVVTARLVDVATAKAACERTRSDRALAPRPQDRELAGRADHGGRRD